MLVSVPGSSLKSRIGAAAIVVVILHIAFSVVVLRSSRKQNSSGLRSLYSHLILLGPFFQESRITSSPHLYISYKVNDSWSPVADPGIANFTFYREHPWRYDKLHYSDFERYIALQVGQKARSKEFQDVQHSRPFRELNHFILREVIREPVDSVSIVYGLNFYSPETKAMRFDTVFNYTYNPNVIGPAKNL